jgi:succinate dehydrogenase (ubiquinone) iron-sulfur subunit
MQSLLARNANGIGKRAFSTSLARAQAVPQQKPVVTKEFKIYRWVRTSLPRQGVKLISTAEP